MAKLVTEPFPPHPDTAEALLETGLINLWYVVARSSDVTDKPVALKRLGRNIVLWRDQDGRINVIDNYCPHRGAPLSMGNVIDGYLTCPYHGVQLDGDGMVVAVPPTPDCPMVGSKSTKAYPCRDHAEAIWVYFGDEAHPVAPEPIFPEEIASDEWTSFLYTAEWQCNWQVSLDNRTDPVHGSYLHTGSFTLNYGRKDAQLKVERTQHGFETWRTNQRGVNIDWHEVLFYPENMLVVRTEIPYPPSIGGGSFRIVGLPTPINRNSTYFWVYRARNSSGWRRDLWRFLYKNRLGPRSDDVVEQDRVLLEAIPLKARQREMLIQTDTAVVRMRRLLLTEAARQLEALGRVASSSPAESGVRKL